MTVPPKYTGPCLCRWAELDIGAAIWQIVLTCEAHEQPEPHPPWMGDEAEYVIPRVSGIMAPQRGNCNNPRMVIRVNAHRFMGFEDVRVTLLHEISHALINALAHEGDTWHHTEAAANLTAHVLRQIPRLLSWVETSYRTQLDLMHESIIEADLKEKKP